MSPTFGYVARDQRGQAVSGQIDGENERAVASRLREDGLFITSIKLARLNVSVESSASDLFSRVSTGDLAMMCRQFSVMLRAGLPILRALSILANQVTKKVLKGTLAQVYNDVQGGTTFAQALSRHTKVFPKMMVHMVQAGELGGAMDTIFERLAIHFEKEKELKGRLVNALMYPAMVVLVSIGVIILLVSFVLPTFMTIFEGMELPAQTKAILWLSNALRANGGLIAILTLVLIVLVKIWAGTESGAYSLDKLVLSIPVVGGIAKKVIMSRFCRTLAILTSSGVPVLVSLDVSKNIVSNRVIAKGLDMATDSIKQGMGIAGPLEATRVFTPMVTQMIRVGEETGSLDEVLSRVSEFYDMEVDSSIRTVVGLIEPIILILMAGLGGTIVSSIILPLFDMMGSM